MDLTVLEASTLQQSLTCFSAGFISALTPCVYPLIPVTIALFTDSCGESKLHHLGRSILYAAGICVVYTCLGLLASQAGIFFGGYLGSPWFIWGASAILFLMVLTNLDIVHLPFFSTLQSCGSKLRGTGYLGSFLLGAGSGLIAAPCIGPILASILMIAASHQQPILGAFLLFLYAVGLSLPFLFLGTFSGLIARLPKGGRWLYWIKFLTAVGVLLTVAYFQRERLNVVIASMGLATVPVAMSAVFAFGILFGRAGINYANPYVKLFGAVLCSVSVYVFCLYTPFQTEKLGASGGIAWSSSLEEKFADQKMIFVDTFATWCASCRELDEKTFSDGALQRELESSHPVRIDFSNYDAVSTAVSDRYNIQGIPTLLFLRANGEEIPGSRVTGFISSDELIERLRFVRASLQDTAQPQPRLQQE